MAVFRQRRVFRTSGTTPNLFGGGVVTATVLSGAIIAFGGTASAQAEATNGGTASGEIAFGGAQPSNITLEVFAGSAVAFGGTAQGLQVTRGTAQPGPIVFAGTASAVQATLTATGAVAFGGTATAAAGFFTAEVASEITFGGTASGFAYVTADGAIAFSGTVGATDITGGTVTAPFSTGAIEFAGTAVPAAAVGASASGAITWAGFAFGALIPSDVPLVARVRIGGGGLPQIIIS